MVFCTVRWLVKMIQHRIMIEIFYFLLFMFCTIKHDRYTGWIILPSLYGSYG